MTQLDDAITIALRSLGSSAVEVPFDVESYIRAFAASAQDKARSVLEALANSEPSLRAQRPVFVSIGGGDGEELNFLLNHSTAEEGVLIEMMRPLAEAARQRNDRMPRGKHIEVFQGDAKDQTVEAIRHAKRMIASGRADFLAVTCHAVIHELFDRGWGDFDPTGFFARIFEDPSIATWFTYREPGVPEKWPEAILLSADCDPRSLLGLAEAICARHASFKALAPGPQVVGDGVRLHRNLAMEVLAKLFYLPDLRHEIQERSTSVNHTHLVNALWTAIGDNAKKQNRANIIPHSGPTSSFVEKWRQYKVEAKGLEGGLSVQLSIAESQTRIVAWRLAAAQVRPLESHVHIASAAPNEAPPADLLVAKQALESKDIDLLSGILVSRGRSWIESVHESSALSLLRAVTSETPNASFPYLWSHYLLSIASLFAGQRVPIDNFTVRMVEAAKAFDGLDLLLQAERMEFARKLDQPDAALDLANGLARSLAAVDERLPPPRSSLASYVVGTARFLLANFMRYGGRYDRAWECLHAAEKCFRRGVESHDAELAHTYYAKCVCAAMTGVTTFDAPSDTSGTTAQRFAGALIQLSYSHASWFVGEFGRAERHAREAVTSFRAIGAGKYAERANQVAALLRVWMAIQGRVEPNFQDVDLVLARAVEILLGRRRDYGWLAGWLSGLRPSKMLGLLQFAKCCGGPWQQSMEITLPRILRPVGAEAMSWGDQQVARSLEEADRLLRRQLVVPLDRRVPLIAD